jgi:hypothetical protein
VVGDLEDVHPRQAPGHELRIDSLLDVAGQQEALAANLAEEHDRDVVDRRSAVGRALGDPPGVGPQHAQADVVDREPVAGRESLPHRPLDSALEPRLPGRVAGTGPDHAGLVDALDAVALEQQDQAPDVILVGVRQDDRVDAAIPRRQSLIECDEQPARVRAAVDEQPAASATLDEDRVALADVNDREARDAIRTMGDREAEAGDRDGQRRRGEPHRAATPGPGRDPRTRMRCWPRGCLGSPPSGARAPRGDSRAGEDQDRRARRRDAIPWRLELEARERHPGARAHGRDDRPVERPCGQAGKRRDNARQAGQRHKSTAERHDAGGHRRRHEGHHDDVHERCHERQAAEIEQDDWQRRGLRRERHAEDLRQPAAWAPGRRTGQGPRQSRAPGDDARGRQGREAEARVIDPCRIDGEEGRDRPAERRRGGAGPAHLSGQERDAGHRRGPHDRRGRPHEDHVGADRHGGQQRPPSTVEAAGDRGQGRRDDRDVPARDRDDMARTGGGEVGREGPVDPVAQADEDPGCETGLRLRNGPRYRFGGGPAQVFEGSPRPGLWRQRRRGLGEDRAGDPDPSEVLAVRTLGRGSYPAGDGDPVARPDDRVPR